MRKATNSIAAAALAIASLAGSADLENNHGANREHFAAAAIETTS